MATAASGWWGDSCSVHGLRWAGLPRDLEEAAQVLRAGYLRHIDVGQVGDSIFFEAGSVGMLAAVSREATKADEGHYGAILRTILAAVRYRPSRMTLELDAGPTIETRALLVAVANGPFMGVGFTVAPGASLEDGQFDVRIFLHYSKRELVLHSASISIGRRSYVPRVRTDRIPSGQQRLRYDCNAAEVAVMPQCRGVDYRPRMSHWTAGGPVAVIGAGGHGRVVAAALVAAGWGVAIGDNRVRQLLAETIDLDWVTVVHPFSWVDASVSLGPGTVVAAGTVVQPGAVIGAHVILNAGALVNHDAVVGDYAHISGAHLGAEASAGQGALLAVASTVVAGVRVGPWATVGAGAVALRDVEPDSTVVGVPAARNRR